MRGLVGRVGQLEDDNGAVLLDGAGAQGLVGLQDRVDGVEGGRGGEGGCGGGLAGACEGQDQAGLREVGTRVLRPKGKKKKRDIRSARVMIESFVCVLN